MANLIMFKSGDALMAADQDAVEAMRQIPQGAHLTVKVSVPRNIRMHRLLFALLNIVFEAQPEPQRFPTTSSLLDAIKLATGYVREVKDLHGRVHIVPDSIAFGRMDQIEFRQWFDAAVCVILDRILPGVEKKDLEQRVYDMLREPGPAQMERH